MKTLDCSDFTRLPGSAAASSPTLSPPLNPQTLSIPFWSPIENRNSKIKNPMKAIVAAIHGILTNQTDPSWPDKLDAWMLQRDPEIKVLKKEYSAGPFSLWNCQVKDPRLARSL